MEQKFKLVISSCKNNTWQGTLWAGEKAVPFKSDLELLLELTNLLSPEERELSNWNICKDDARNIINPGMN